MDGPKWISSILLSKIIMFLFVVKLFLYIHSLTIDVSLYSNPYLYSNPSTISTISNSVFFFLFYKRKRKIKFINCLFSVPIYIIKWIRNNSLKIKQLTKYKFDLPLSICSINCRYSQELFLCSNINQVTFMLFICMNCCHIYSCFICLRKKI